MPAKKKNTFLTLSKEDNDKLQKANDQINSILESITSNPSSGLHDSDDSRFGETEITF